MRYYDDLAVGMKFKSGTLEVTEEQIIDFAKRFDPQPFHIDVEAAKGSVFGELVSSGWLTASLSVRLLVTGEAQLACGYVGLGAEQLNWPRPVRPGDTLTVVSEVVAMRLSRKKRDRGVVQFRHQTYNQRNEVVLELLVHQLVTRHPDVVAAESGASEA